jgi:hypothetical protein
MHLEAAFYHYCKKEFVVALHLAGAAEEILGKVAAKKTNSNALMERISRMEKFHKNFNRIASIRVDYQGNSLKGFSTNRSSFNLVAF